MPGTIARNLRMGLRILLPLRIGVADIRPSLVSTFIGLGLSLLTLGVCDYLRQEGEIMFSDFGATALGSILFAVLFVSIIVAWMQSAIERLPLLLTTLFSASPWFLITICAYREIGSESPLLAAGWIVLLGWGVSIVVRIIRMTFGPQAYRAAAVAVSAAILAIFIVQDRYFELSLFHSYDPEEYERFDNLDVEGVYYRQAMLLTEKLQHLLKERPNIADTYFVGFAGNGEQSIFLREVLFAKDVVEKQFDARGRSISLANQLDNLADEPLANRHNLRTVLKHVGEIIDSEEDAVFLFLTSHGSADATLDTSLYPLELQDLSADDLRSYLDESGILWRIIVVSACYSGSFIDPLRDDRTLVITASASDRNSFGCSDDRDLTYFGEEFLEKQLANDDDLIEVFNATTVNIEAREIAEGLTPSQPQIFIGPLIRDKLDARLQ